MEKRNSTLRTKKKFKLKFLYFILPDPGVNYVAHKFHRTHSIVHHRHPVPMSQHLEVDCMNTILVNHNPFDLILKEKDNRYNNNEYRKNAHFVIK